MSNELHGPKQVGCPACSSVNIQFSDVERHACQEYADLSFWCPKCASTIRYSITNTNGELSAVWSAV